jgi:hypothetical protein
VRHAACCISLADIADPLAEDRGVREGVTPKCLRNVGPVLYELSQWTMRDKAQHAIAKRDDIVIHDVKKKALQIGNVTQLMECQDLTLASADDLRSQHKPLDDQTAGGRPIPDGRDCLTIGHLPSRYRETVDRALIFLIDLGADPQSFQKRCCDFRFSHLSFSRSKNAA